VFIEAYTPSEEDRWLNSRGAQSVRLLEAKSPAMKNQMTPMTSLARPLDASSGAAVVGAGVAGAGVGGTGVGGAGVGGAGVGGAGVGGTGVVGAGVGGAGVGPGYGSSQTVPEAPQQSRKLAINWLRTTEDPDKVSASAHVAALGVNGDKIIAPAHA